jgi:adenine-specific DNA-methyltransferase
MTLRKKPLIRHYAVKSENLAFLQDQGQAIKGQVDFIYLDPPNNAGRSRSLTNPKPTKRGHEKWLQFMEPRIAASKPYLKPEGVIAVSIGDSELPRLRIIMDDVFGEPNFIGMITIDTGNVTNNARFLSSSHEYLLLYANDMQALLKSGVKWRTTREGLGSLRRQEKKLRAKFGSDYIGMSEELKEWFKSQDLPVRLKQFNGVDVRGLYAYSDLSAPKNGLSYDVVNPNTGSKVAVPSRGWGVSEETFLELIETDNIIWGATDKQQPLKKLYLKDTPDQVIRTVMSIPSRSPERLLHSILGKDVTYAQSKDLDFMKYLIEVFTGEDALIMDFFAGSGTTGHAVLELNYENPDVSKRQFVLVSNDEHEVYSKVMLPRLEAVISGRWFERQKRPRRAELLKKI